MNDYTDEAAAMAKRILETLGFSAPTTGRDTDWEQDVINTTRVVTDALRSVREQAEQDAREKAIREAAKAAVDVDCKEHPEQYCPCITDATVAILALLARPSESGAEPSGEGGR